MSERQVGVESVHCVKRERERESEIEKHLTGQKESKVYLARLDRSLIFIMIGDRCDCHKVMTQLRRENNKVSRLRAVK